MKTIKIAALMSLLILLSGFTVYAQQIDMQRMNQDINIMGGVLVQMLENVYNHFNKTTFGYEYKNVHGTYLQNYGVIFQINPSYTFIRFVNSKEKKENSDNSHATKETIINKIVEFLGNYGPTIQQLSSDNHIMVLFNGIDKPGVRFIGATGQNMRKRSQYISVISVVAKESDIRAYQRGDLSKKKFRQQLSISTQKPNESKNQDLKIFANILKTAFKKDDSKEFKISSDIDYQHISNFGALFSFSIDYGNGFMYLSSHTATSTSPQGLVVPTKPIIVTDLSNDTSRSHKTDSLRRVITIHSRKRRKAIQKRLTEIQKKIAKYQNITTKKHAQQTADIKDALHTFISNLKKYIVEYGGTLNSIPSNQYVMVSVKVDDNMDNIPEKIVLQVKKSVPEAASQGNVSRKKAMDKIQVEKY